MICGCRAKTDAGPRQAPADETRAVGVLDKDQDNKTVDTRFRSEVRWSQDRPAGSRPWVGSAQHPPVHPDAL